MSRFAKAIGIWELGVGGVSLELRPKMEDVRLFRNILVNDANRKEKSLLFSKFVDFMYGMIKRDLPEEVVGDGEQELREWLELWANPLLEEAMIAFKWTSRDELDKQKKESLSDLKKAMSDA